MKTYKIAVIPGDGIGPEVIQEGIKLLNYISNVDSRLNFEIEYFPWGSTYYLKNGVMMPQDGIKRLSKFDAIYLGAVGDPSVPDHVTLWDLLLEIRHSFDQYVNLRPIKLLKGAPKRLNMTADEKIDMLFIRENTEGEYAGLGEIVNLNTDEETAYQTSVFSKKGVERIIRYAFEQARIRKQTLTSITKSNALNYSMVYWDQKFQEISSEYPDISTHQYLVDAAAMLMITDPSRFEVVVTSNLFGDILTDLGAAITGGMGLAAGANINPEKKFPSMFEPVHGSAPNIAGKLIANPLAALWSIGQMMTHFGFNDWEIRILKAIEKLLTSGKVLTPDLGGSKSTSDVGTEIIQILSEGV